MRFPKRLLPRDGLPRCRRGLDAQTLKLFDTPSEVLHPENRGERQHCIRKPVPKIEAR